MAEKSLVEMLAVGARVKIVRFAWITDEEMRAIATPSVDAIWATISGVYEGGMYVKIRVDIKGQEMDGLVSLYDVLEIQLAEPLKQVVVSTTMGAVNDHVCATCGNDRCSRTERSCWRCGAPISV